LYSSNRYGAKTVQKIDDQLPVFLRNIELYLEGKQLKTHKLGGTLNGRITGPKVVTMGHDHSEGQGVGPDLPVSLSIVYAFIYILYDTM
jgi:hypothetical protein